MDTLGRSGLKVDPSAEQYNENNNKRTENRGSRVIIILASKVNFGP
jgi:hypothetical protein